MKVEGRVRPPKGKDKYWSVEIPVLEIYTQGTSEADAYGMAADAVRELTRIKGLSIALAKLDGGRFLLFGMPNKEWTAFVLRRIRSVGNITLEAMAERLGVKSPNAYARYEQGKAMPSAEKLERLIEAVDPSYSVILKRM